MDNDSEDIYIQNKIEKYLTRPTEFSNILYGQYFSEYTTETNDVGLNDTDHAGPINPDRRVVIRKLAHPRIVRYYMYRKYEKDEKEKYFSQLLLCNCALLLSDFTEKPLRFRFHANNTTTTFEEECRIRNIDESKRLPM